MKKIYNSKLFDLLIISLIFIVSLLFVNYFENYFVNTPSFIAFYFMAPQLLYLSLKKMKNWYTISLTIILVGVFGGFLFSFIAQVSDAWTLPYSAFPKLLEVYAFEDVIYSSVMVTQVIVFYQHFSEDSNLYLKHKVSKRYFKILFYILLLSAILSFICYINPNFLKIKYAYIIYLFPLLFYICYHFLKKRTYYIKKFLNTNIFMFFFYFFIEYIAVRYEIWVFEGEYIGFININDVSYPIEEIIVFFIFYTPAVLSCYEGLVKNN